MKRLFQSLKANAARLNTPWAIVIGAVLGSFILVYGAKYVGQSIWLALSAIGTIGAVVVAVHRDFILKWWERPKLDISLYEPRHPHLIRIPMRIQNLDPHPVTGERDDSVMRWTRFVLRVTLRNTGKSIARTAQAFIRGVASMKDGKWQKKDDWIDVALSWAFSAFDPAKNEREIAEARDLVPFRSYLFDIGELSTESPHAFALEPLAIMRSPKQRSAYGPGKHCFEITAYALGVDPVTKYFCVEWSGGCTDDFDDVKTKIRVFARDHPPWWREFESRVVSYGSLLGMFEAVDLKSVLN